MMIDDVQHIENVSDYECTEARSLATDTDKKLHADANVLGQEGAAVL